MTFDEWWKSKDGDDADTIKDVARAAHAAGVVEGMRRAEEIARAHRRMDERPAAVYRVAAAEVQEAIATERVSLETGERGGK